MTTLDTAPLAAAPASGLGPLLAFYLGLLLVVALVALGVWTWGVAVLAMTALALVPVMFVVLIVISRG
jgi:hypothetical protein